jgi:hypothetical protein
MRDSRSTIAAVSVAMAGSLLWLPSAQSHEVHFTGRATGINGVLNVATVKKSLLVTDVLMSCSGTAREETASAISNPEPLLVNARNVHAYTIGRDDVAASNASIEEFHLQFPSSNGSGPVTIDATAAQSNAESRCNESTLTITRTGGSSLASLKINGQGQALSGEPNQQIALPGNLGTLIVNERDTTTNSREIVVNALHVKVADPQYPVNGDILFAHSRAKVTCSR